MTAMEPQPEPTSPMRIGDAERSAVSRALERHYAEGRLTVTELEDRLVAANESRTVGDLQPLLADLPAIAGEDAPLPATIAPPSAAAAASLPGDDARPGRLLPMMALYPFLMACVMTTIVWAVTGRGYFWPGWVYFGCAWPVGGIIVGWLAKRR